MQPMTNLKAAALLLLLSTPALAEPYVLTVGNADTRDAKVWVTVYSRGTDNDKRQGTLYSKKVPVKADSMLPDTEVAQVPFLTWTETCASIVGATNPEAFHCAAPRRMSRLGTHCAATIAPSSTPRISVSCVDGRL